MYAEKMSSYGSLISEDVSTMDESQDSGHGSRFASIWDEMPLSCGEIIWQSKSNAIISQTFDYQLHVTLAKAV